MTRILRLQNGDEFHCRILCDYFIIVDDFFPLFAYYYDRHYESVCGHNYVVYEESVDLRK